MPHCIELPVDEIYAINPAWHGLEIPCPDGITEDHVNRLCPVIREEPLFVTIDDIRVDVEKTTFVADYGQCRPDVKNEHRFAILGTHSNSYKAISNADLYQTLKKAVGTDGKIVTAGTLGAGKRVFFSVAINGEEEFNVFANGRNDLYKGFLNFASSHDGTLAASFYQSTVRIVCQNTLNLSISNSMDMQKVYHTTNAAIKLSNVADIIQAMLQNRKEFVQNMMALADIGMNYTDARDYVAGYFAGKSATPNFSTQARNATESIASLFANGRGNVGKSAYDLLNGATEYWTSGAGVGRNATPAARVSSGMFGSAMDHKINFVSGLLDENTRSIWKHAGEVALAS